MLNSTDDNLKHGIDIRGLEKLLEEQAKGTKKSQENRSIWTKYKDDYVALRKQLETITDKVSYKVMVPIGRFAFMPGRLKHTNEVTVLLGDNWFAERSAKQAVEIVGRRLKQCNDMLEKLEKEEQLYESWRKQTEAMQSELSSNKGMEIIEPFDEEQEQLWRVNHKDNMKDHRQKLSEEKDTVINKPVTPDEEELWRRLDELELQEELEHEADLLGEDEESEPSTISEESENTDDEEDAEPATPERKRVTWSESDSVRQFHRDEVIDMKEESYAAENRITFQHSRTVIRQLNNQPDDAQIQSPSDIYNSFNVDTSESPEPKSILRVKKSTTPVREPPELVQSSNQAASLPSTTCPVNDEIKEREPLAVTPCAESVQPFHRPVSRFKAARQAARPVVP